MGLLNFLPYAQAIQHGMAKGTKIGITKMLLGCITENEHYGDIEGNDELYFIDGPKVTKWWKQTEDIPGQIKKVAALPDVIFDAPDYFDNVVFPKLAPQKLDNTLAELRSLITQDSNIPLETKDKLLSLCADNDINGFLAETFLYAILNDNRIKNNYKIIPTSSTSEDIKKLQELLNKLPKPIELVPPNDLEEHEMPYVKELFAAYADAEGLDEFNKDTLDSFKRYKRNFTRQRKDYYAAESIRQSVRDAMSPIESKEFDILKDETLDGIAPVHEKCYPNGFERLNSVMEHATILKVNKSLLVQLPGWVGPCETKGVCHMLVNDGEIRWVDIDD